MLKNNITACTVAEWALRKWKIGTGIYTRAECAKDNSKLTVIQSCSLANTLQAFKSAHNVQLLRPQGWTSRSQ